MPARVGTRIKDVGGRLRAWAVAEATRAAHGARHGGWAAGSASACWLALVLAFPGASSATTDGPRQPEVFSIQTWQTEHGLPQNSVTSLIQSRAGYLWFGTFNGLVRFDGLRFKVFDSANTPGLCNSRITCLFENAAGTLWIGHESGELTRLSHGRFESVDLVEGSKARADQPEPSGRIEPQASKPGPWSGGAIVGIAADEDEELWLLGNRGRLLRLRDRWSLPAPGTSAEPSGNPSLVRDGSGRLWVVRNGTAAVKSASDARSAMRNPEWNVVRFGSPDPQAFFSRLCAGQKGGLWVVGEGRVRQWDGQAWVRDVGPCPWGNGFVTAMLETAPGRLLVGTLDQGLFVFEPSGHYFHLGWTNGLPQDWVRCLAEDREGNIWVGTSDGLSILRARKVAMFNPPDHWQGKSLLAATQAKDGSIWVGTEGAGLYQLKAGASAVWTRFGPEEGLSNPFIWSVLEDQAGRLWVGTWGSGVFLKAGERFTKPPALASFQEAVTALAESPAGVLWFGTSSGLMRFAEERLESFAALGGPAAADVRALCGDEEGTIWLGTLGAGLGRVQGSKLRQFGRQDGLGSQFILSLCLEEHRALWLGTMESGLWRFEDGRFSGVNSQHGLPSNLIGQISDDQKGHFWLASQRGLFRTSKEQLHRCADRRAWAIDCTVYGKEEGLATLACSGKFVPSHARPSDDRLWFPTAKGLAAVDLSEVHPSAAVPPVLLEDVFIDGKPATLRGQEPAARGPQAGRSKSDEAEPGLPSESSRWPSLVVPPGQSRVEVHFTAISFAAPEKVRFKCRLEGLEPGWTETEGRRSLNYAYLPPGDYLFRTIACNNDGVWNEEGASLAIKVLPQFWQTWRFKTAAAVGLLGAVGGAIYLDTRRRLRRKLVQLEQQRALERERARIARDIHDDLGASLTRITLLSQTIRGDLNPGSEAAAGVDQICATARDLTRAMDEIVWATSPRHDTMDSLMTYLGRYAQSFLSAAAIRCRLDLPLHLPAWTLTAEVRHNLFLAFKEALNNVVSHARASEVRISLELGRESFTLVVADNGCGFQPNPRPQRVAHGPGEARLASGNGLENMQKRLEEIGGRCEWETAPGEGTRVKLVLVIKS